MIPPSAEVGAWVADAVATNNHFVPVHVDTLKDIAELLSILEIAGWNPLTHPPKENLRA